MKYVVFVRHGSYSENTGRLNGCGVEQMRLLAEKLRLLSSDSGRFRLICSIAPRAVDSALELFDALKLDGFEAHGLLWSDNRHQQRDDAALELIRHRGEGADSLIVVSHLDYVRDLPPKFAKRTLGQTIETIELSKGQARLIDCRAARPTDLILS
jgi:phosphohistidine phosphatase SixA